MKDLLVSFLLLSGAAFSILGSLGMWRMPDLYTRLQASTKAGTLGVACIMCAAAIHFADLAVAVRALLVVAFLFLTAPVAAHIIARAAHFTRVPLWEHNTIDELGDVRRRPTGASPPAPPGVAKVPMHAKGQVVPLPPKNPDSDSP
jgi:multicomponent Na+:H+ antiporter subunit G